MRRSRFRKLICSSLVIVVTTLLFNHLKHQLLMTYEPFNITCLVPRKPGPNRLVYEVDCQRLINGDKQYISIARDIMTEFNYRYPTDRQIGDLAQNCSKFQEIYNYNLYPVSREELDFPIAYTILTYKDAIQTEKLLHTIYRPHNVYCIHVDTISETGSSLLYAMTSIADCLPNVFVASKLEDVIYAGFSRLKADLNCMSDLLHNTDMKWRGENVEATGKKKEPPPYNITIGKGSAYGVFSWSFVNYSINDVKAQGILQWLEDTYSPDEFFWATLASNKHLNVPGVLGYTNRKLWIASSIKWHFESEDCQGKFVHDVCVFGIGDLSKLVPDKQLFANKFYHDYQPLALQCMEEWNLNKSFDPAQFETYYYRKLISSISLQ